MIDYDTATENQKEAMDRVSRHISEGLNTLLKESEKTLEESGITGWDASEFIADAMRSKADRIH